MENIESFAKKHNITLYTELPNGWVEDHRATTAPKGSVWINNNKSRFSGERKQGLLIKEG